MISPSPAQESSTRAHENSTQAVKPAWQREFAEAIRSVDELCSMLEIDPSLIPGLSREADFPLRVPRSFVQRMRPGDPKDPLLLQVLPLTIENDEVQGFTTDPLQEGGAMPVPGLLHKYRGRALLVSTGACAIHCRYCFRRSFPYGEQTGKRHWAEALRYLAQHPEIDEVILSGGDPLSIRDQTLFELISSLADIPHLQRLRLHSRLPVVLPSRLEPSTVKGLTATRLEPILVIHANHPREINSEVAKSLEQLPRNGIVTLNQAVLLREINDSSTTLAELNRRLFSSGVLPYYLSLLDRVEGTAHFEVGEQEAREILWELIESQPGYLVPKLVREVPGAGAKMPVDLGAQSRASTVIGAASLPDS